MNAVLTEDEIGVLLSAAVHAPSIHNSQPWRFEVHGPVVDVRLDEERILPVSDPAGRAARIATGAAVFNVRVAAAMLGHESRTAIDPDPARPDVVARLFLTSRTVPIPGLSSLYREIARRRTYRGPLLDQPVSDQVLDRLRRAALAEDVTLRTLTADERAHLAGILRRAESDELHDEDELHERQVWVGGDRTVEGVPTGALGPVPVRPAFVRDLAAGFAAEQRGEAVFETDPLIVVLTTPDEDPATWVQAGIALQHVLLVATSYGLTASFLDQVLERGDSRHRLRDLIGGHAWPQLVLRLGFPAQAGDRTGRRDWHESFDQWF